MPRDKKVAHIINDIGLKVYDQGAKEFASSSCSERQHAPNIKKALLLLKSQYWSGAREDSSNGYREKSCDIRDQSHSYLVQVGGKV